MWRSATRRAEGTESRAKAPRAPREHAHAQGCADAPRINRAHAGAEPRTRRAPRREQAAGPRAGRAQGRAGPRAIGTLGRAQGRAGAGMPRSRRAGSGHAGARNRAAAGEARSGHAEPRHHATTASRVGQGATAAQGGCHTEEGLGPGRLRRAEHAAMEKGECARAGRGRAGHAMVAQRARGGSRAKVGYAASERARGGREGWGRGRAMPGQRTAT
jgi:hypothetical protein